MLEIRTICQFKVVRFIEYETLSTSVSLAGFYWSDSNSDMYPIWEKNMVHVRINYSVDKWCKARLDITGIRKFFLGISFSVSFSVT